MKRPLSLATLLLCLLLTGCAGKTIQSHEGKQPRLRPETFFAGHVKGWGFSENRWGSINQFFQVEFRGEQHGDTSVWHETLRYPDGRVNRRTWKIRRRGNHEYDVLPTEKISRGTGIAYGNAVRWNYYLDVDYAGSEWTLWVDDWMYRKDADTIVVRATLSRFGLTMGYGYMVLRRVN